MTLDHLREELAYDPSTGHFYWLVRRKGRRIDRPAGSVTARKGVPTYVTICVDGKNYQAHRLAWWFMTGHWPLHEVDHWDLDKQNNRWANLRKAAPALNAANSRARALLPKGVTRCQYPKSRPYCAKITVAGKCRNLGYYADAEMASEAYFRAAETAFGEFARS